MMDKIPIFHKEKIFIIIPSFNEGTVIRNTILPLVGKYDIVIIDDASSDNTFQYLKDLPIHYLRHSINLGQGAALQTGMEYACQQGADIVVHFDADGQHNSEDIDRFIDVLKINPVDIVLGSRFLRQQDVNAIPFFRRLLLRTARVINGLITGMWLTDAHNGFRVMSSQAASQIDLRENRMAHATEILIIIKRKKIQYIEEPTHIVYTNYSQQKGQRWQNAFNILFDVFINKYFR